MPLKKDEMGGGSNADGTISKVYCSKCYAKGAFTSPDITVEELQVRVKEKMNELGFPSFIAGFFTKRIPKLERWRK